MTCVRVVAEIGQGHGDLGWVKDAVQAAAAVGCWAVKVQHLHPDLIASPAAGRYWATAPGDGRPQRDVFRSQGVWTLDQLTAIAGMCADAGVTFAGTAFDPAAVDDLVAAGVGALKVASGDITYRRLLDRVAAAGLPVWLSTGAATTFEIDRAANLFTAAGRETVVMACTLAYPTQPADANLSRVRQIAARRPAGYSDHTQLVETGLAAVCAGATLLEKHFTVTPDGGCPDDEMALDPGRMAEYVRLAHLGATLTGGAGETISPVHAEDPARFGARRSMRWAADLPAGHIVTAGDVVELRPGVADHSAEIGPWDWQQLVGRVTSQAVRAGDRCAGGYL